MHVVYTVLHHAMQSVAQCFIYKNGDSWLLLFVPIKMCSHLYQELTLAVTKTSPSSVQCFEYKGLYILDIIYNITAEPGGE